MPSADWRFLICDITTGQTLDDLPLSQVALTTRLNGGGAFSAAVALDQALDPDTREPTGDSLIRARDTLTRTIPLASTVVPLRNGQVIGEWQIIDRGRPTFGAIAFTGAELIAHTERRFVTGRTWTGVDQFTIARQLVWDAFGDSIWLELGSDLSGVPRTRTEWAAGSKTAFDALAELSAVDGGFDYWIETANLSGGDTLDLHRFLRLEYPRAGIDATDRVVFDIPTPSSPYGTVTAFPGLIEQGARYANRVIAIGDGILEDAAVEPITIEGRRMPVTELAGSWTSVSSPSVLQSHADALLASSSSFVANPTIQVLADGTDENGDDIGPSLGDWRLGDRARFRMEPTHNYPDGIDQVGRIVGWTMRPTGAGPELVDLEVEWTTRPNVAPPDDLMAQMTELRRRLADLETR